MSFERVVRLGFVFSIGAAVFTMQRPVGASGFSVARFGGEHGHPTATNATAVYFNPAALAFSEGNHLFFDATVAWRRVTYDRARSDTSEPPGAEGANSGRARLFNIIPSPMGGATTKLGDFGFGAAIFTPFGGQSSWKQNDEFQNHPSFAGPLDGTQRWYSIAGTLRSSYVSLGAAYQLPNTGFSIGVAGNLVWTVVETLRARQASGTDALATEGRSWLDVSGLDFGFGAGLMYEAMPERLWFGLSYQSRPNVSGGMVLDGTLTNFFVGQTNETEVDLHQDLPDLIRAGVSYRPLPTLELRLSGDYTRWSAFEQQCLAARGAACAVDSDGSEAEGARVILNQPRDWNDTFGVRAGASLWTKRSVELFGGAGFSSNAVPDETLEPALPDWHGISMALGGRFAIFEQGFLALSYTQFFYIPRDNVGQGRLNEFVGVSRGPNAEGHYSQQVGVLNANLDVGF